MNCAYFGLCGSCKVYDIGYNEQLEQKKVKIEDSFKEFGIKNIDIIKSQDSHYRSRAEFRIWREGESIFYAMNKADKKGLLTINSCKIVDKNIFNLMPKLLDSLRSCDILRQKLFAVEFLSSSIGELLVTLIYHKKIEQNWIEEAEKLSNSVHAKIIGRSRKVKLIVSDDFIDEELNIDEKKYRYKLYEGGFTQPNTKVNEQMITWVKNKVAKTDRDLLELYCGHGNFTIPLSRNFRKVLATEISKTSIKAAKQNSFLNDISNIDFARMSSEELTSALKKEREFRRLKDIDIDAYDFRAVFVDPPRAGLDEKSLAFIKSFENIIYISCNPVTLKRDLRFISKTHKVEDFAIFDQFPYTEHLECGVVLTKF